MSLASTFAAFLVLLAAFTPAFWIAARLARRSRTATVWLRRAIVALWAVAGLSYLVLLGAGLGDVARTGVAALGPLTADSLVGAFAAQLAVCLGAAGVTLAAYAPLVPAIRDARELELSVATALRRLGRYAVAFALLLSALLALLLRATADGGSTLAWLVLLGAIAALPLAAPYASRLFRATRSPDAAERDRLRRLCDRAGLDVDAVVILADADETLELHVYGVPGRRRLFVSTYALEAFDDEPIAALLAIRAGRLRSHHRGIAVHSVFAFLVALVGALLLGSTAVAFGVLALGIVLAGPTLWAARRAVVRADDHAGAAVGREAVAAALERAADEQNLDIGRGSRWSLLKTRPPLGRRIDRLRGRA